MSVILAMLRPAVFRWFPTLIVVLQVNRHNDGGYDDNVVAFTSSLRSTPAVRVILSSVFPPIFLSSSQPAA